MFEAPKFELKPRRVIEIPFRGKLLASAMETLNSGLISYPFKVTKVKMIFLDEANNRVVHRWHILDEAFRSGVSGPLGSNLFGREAPTASFVGRSIIRVVECNVEFPEGMKRISLFTNNTSPYAYDYNCAATIEELY